jgi:hypothetical protein
LLLSDAEKATLAEIAQRRTELAALAKPDTLLAWYRKLIAKNSTDREFANESVAHELMRSRTVSLADGERKPELGL